MPALKLYYHPLSQPSRAVVWFIAKNKVEGIEMKVIDIIKRENMGEEFTAINPFQSVPVLTIDGEPLLESGAILTYLSQINNRADQPPADATVGNARVTEALLLHDNLSRVVTTHLFRPAVVGKMANPNMTDDDVKACFAKDWKGICWNLGFVDGRLGKSKFIAGDEFTLPDYLVAAELTQLTFLEKYFPEGATISGTFSNIARYLKDLQSVGAYESLVAPFALLQPPKAQ